MPLRDARHLGISDATVAKAWREYRIQPWRAESFRFSTDPLLVGKVTDVVGLYLNQPENDGRAHLLSGKERRRVRRLWQPGGALFWSYLLDRTRGHRMHAYEIRLTEPASNIFQTQRARISAAYAYRIIQLTARSSALLFAAAQTASALGQRTGRIPKFFYLAFMAAHAAHFAAVATYVRANGGRDLFAGGRSMNDVGGWPTVAGIYALFSGLAVTGLAAGSARSPSQPSHRVIGQAATWVMAAMFVGVYAGAAATIAVERPARHRHHWSDDRRRFGSTTPAGFG